MKGKVLRKRVISVILICGMLLPSMGCAGKKETQDALEAETAVSFREDGTPSVQLTTNYSCFKDSITEASITLQEITDTDGDDDSEESDQIDDDDDQEEPDQTEEDDDEQEESALTVGDVVYQDDQTISFVVNGEIDYEASYMLVVAEDETTGGAGLTVFMNGTEFIQEIIAKTDVEELEGNGENPVIEITFQNGTISPALELSDIYMEQAFSGLTIEKAVLTTGSVLTIYTKGTLAGNVFEEGQIRFSSSVFVEYYKDVVASVKVEREAIYLDHESLSFEKGVIQGKLVLASGTWKGVPEIACDQAEVTVTAETLTKDESGVTVSFSTNETEADDAFAAVNGSTLTIAGKYLSTGKDVCAVISVPKATISTHVDTVTEEEDGYLATVTLFANAGTLEKLKTKNITVTGDYTDAKVTKCTANDYGYEVCFTFTSKKGIEETTLNGTLTIEDGLLVNEWGTASDQTSCKLYYSTEGDRAEGDTLDTIKALWAEYGDTISAIPSVYSAAITALETFGVLESNEAAVNRKLDSIQDQVDGIAEDVKYLCQTVNKINSLTSSSEVHFDKSEYNNALNTWKSNYALLTNLQYMLDRYQELSDSYVDNWLKKIKVIHVYEDEYGNLTYPVTGQSGRGYDKSSITNSYDVSCKDIKAADLSGILSYLQDKQVHKVTFDNGIAASMAGDGKTLTIPGVDGTASYVTEEVDAVRFSDGTVSENVTKGTVQTFQLADGTSCYVMNRKVYREEDSQYIADYFSYATVMNYNGKLLREVSNNFWDYNENVPFERRLSDGSVDTVFVHIFDGVTTSYGVSCIVRPDGIAEIVATQGDTTEVTVEGKGTGIMHYDGSISFPETNEKASYIKNTHNYIEYADGTRMEASIVEESYENEADRFYEAFLLEMNYEIMNNEAMKSLDTVFYNLCAKISSDDYSQGFFDTYYTLLSYVYNFDSQTLTDKENMRVLVEETLRKARPLASLYQEFHGTTIKNQTTLTNQYTEAVDFILNTLDEEQYLHQTTEGEAYCYVNGKNLKLHTLEAYAYGENWNWFTSVSRMGNFGIAETGYRENFYTQDRGGFRGYEAGISMNTNHNITGSHLNKNTSAALSSAELAVMSARATKLRGTTLYQDILTVYGITDTKKELTKIVTSTSEMKVKAGGSIRVSASELTGIAGSKDGVLEYVMCSDRTPAVGDTKSPRGSYDAYVKLSGSVYDTATGTEYNDYSFGTLVYYYTRKGYEEWCAYGNHAKYLLLSTN